MLWAGLNIEQSRKYKSKIVFACSVPGFASDIHLALV